MQVDCFDVLVVYNSKLKVNC